MDDPILLKWTLQVRQRQFWRKGDLDINCLP